MIGSWIEYLLKRKSEYKIHSPFVYDFMRKVLNDHGTNRDYDTIYRIARLLDKRKHISYNQRKQSRLLYRLVRYFEPESVVSFGKLSALNTSALALGHLQTKVYLEESDDFLETLNSMGIVNVSLIQPAEFDSEHFKRLNTGFVFFSRDSFEEDTWDYLADCLSHKTSESVFVFEGIHHDRDMQDAWEEIKANEDVSVTFDLYCVGLVFFREGIEKQDFVLKY
ncbi:MAG: hypothetical protein II862_09830 [Bacteroidales bacterium]|nr:hypothetical protein [Bacteroidales bacterium]